MELTLGKKSLTLPILQGGMGVGVSLERLAGAVAACGGMGTISTALCGFREPDFEQDPAAANLRALDRQVRQAKEAAKGAGMVAVNVMVATAQYADSVRTALRAGVDAVVCGAGLPTDLPAIFAQVPESTAAMAPVVSGGRSASVLCRLWDRHYGVTPDFVVLEGPLAGGHLGFTPEQAQAAQAGNPKPLSELLAEVLTALTPFGKSISGRSPYSWRGLCPAAASWRRICALARRVRSSAHPSSPRRNATRPKAIRTHCCGQKTAMSKLCKARWECRVAPCAVH